MVITSEGGFSVTFVVALYCDLTSFVAVGTYSPSYFLIG